MKNNKGFTLIEVMVALTIIMLIIFAFTPLTVYSFKQIYQSGDGQKQLYAQKSTIEKKLSTRDENFGLPSVTIDTVFKETVSPAGHTISKTGPIAVTGFLISDSGNPTDFELATVYTGIHAEDNKAKIRLVPNSVNEDEEMVGRVLYVYSEFFLFSEEDIDRLRLYDKTGHQVNEVTFSYINNTTVSMTFNSSSAVTASMQPYVIKLGDSDSLSARLFVEPPNIIVASANGRYYTSRGIAGGSESENPVFYEVDHIIADSVNDIVWDNSNSRYIAVGNNGIFRTLSGGSAWDSRDITGTGSMVYYDILILSYRNNTPSINAVNVDFNGIPVIGGTFPYQERQGWLLRWTDAGIDGFFTDYFINQTNREQKFPNLRYGSSFNLFASIDNINDMITSIRGNNILTIGVGGSSNDALIVARSPNINNGEWFKAINDLYGYSEATGVASGISYLNNNEIPIYIFCTLDGRLFSSNNIVRNGNWNEEDIGSGKPANLSLSAITYGGNKFVAVGNSRKSLTGTVNSNGRISWEFNNITNTSASFNDVAYINDRFYAVGQKDGNGIIYTSTNGKNWIEALIDNGSSHAQSFTAIAGRNQQ